MMSIDEMAMKAMPKKAPMKIDCFNLLCCLCLSIGLVKKAVTSVVGLVKETKWNLTADIIWWNLTS